LPGPLSHGKSVGVKLLRHLGAVGGAAALALARVLAFAAVVAGLAAALALAAVLALTSVLFLHLFVGSSRLVVLSGYSGLDARQIRRFEAGTGACEQSRNRRARDEKLI
jgi:hypothetical protein